MNTQIISNKVYESLQQPTENLRTTTGKVLYANEYSGIARVAMPDDLKALIDSDFGLVGKNLLIQLEHKMRGYPNGPWYVDSRDGVIYIHNRKFHEDPVTIYHYQHENGEVLRASFSTQEQTKKVKVSLTSSIDPDTKDVISDITDIDTGKDEGELSKFIMPDVHPNENNGVYYSNWNTSIGKYGAENNPQDIQDVMGLKIAYALSDPQLQAYFKSIADERARKLAEREESKKIFQADGPAAAQSAGLDKYLNQMSDSELNSKIQSYRAQLNSNVRAALDAVDTSPNNKNLEEDIRIALAGTVITLKDGGYTYYDERDIDPRPFDPKGESFSNRVATARPGMGEGNKGAADRGFQALKDDPYCEVMDDNYTVRYSKDDTPGAIHDPSGAHTSKITVKAKVGKMFEEKQIPLSRLYSNLFSRYGGASKFQWAANANANGGLKTTEKRLICQMTVVGRPSLESSQVINLQNVGKRWSGYWYIKTCTHKMDAGQGYTTDLELVKNNARAGFNTSQTNLSTQNIVANNAKANAKTDRGKDKVSKGSKHSLNTLNFTQQEADYFKKLYLTDSGTYKDIASRRAFEEDVRKKVYYTEVVTANDPIARARGTIYTYGDTFDENGNLIKGKVVNLLDTIKVPEDYWFKFDYLGVSMKRFREYIKNNKLEYKLGRN